MIRISTLFLLILSFFAGCQSDKISEDDLSGKTFSAKFISDSTQKESSGFAKLLEVMVMGNAQLEYTFSQDHAATRKVTMGMMAESDSFTWAIEGDSLKLINNPKKSSESFLVQKQKDGTIKLAPHNGPCMELTAKN
jgi:hypothetical protein